MSKSKPSEPQKSMKREKSRKNGNYEPPRTQQAIDTSPSSFQPVLPISTPNAKHKLERKPSKHGIWRMDEQYCTVKKKVTRKLVRLKSVDQQAAQEEAHQRAKESLARVCGILNGRR